MQKYLVSTALFIGMLYCCASVALAQNPAADKAAATKIVQLLEGSKQVYTKANEGVWVVKFKGNHLADISVIAVHSGGLLVLAAPVANKADFKATPELLQKLLKLNDDFDRVKVAVDEDGDVLVRVDFTLRIADQTEFNANVEQVSATADLTYQAMLPFLNAPKKPVK